jgi:hypothetical protein
MAKRLKGEGSVYRRKDGRWVASITLENGQRKTVYCKSKQEANKERLRLFQEMERGLQIDLTDQTVDEFFKDWLNGIEINVRARISSLSGIHHPAHPPFPGQTQIAKVATSTSSTTL